MRVHADLPRGTRHCRSLIASLSCAILAACAGNGSGLDASGRPLSEGGGSSGGITSTFASIQANVFSPICTACHAGASAPLGLRLDEVNSYGLLVGVPSVEVPSLQRVRAGDPDNSYIVQKLEGRAAVGGQMPLGGPVLPAATIAAIRQWIAAGALRTTSLTGGAAGAFEVTMTAPGNVEQVATAPAVLVLEFSHELDTTRVTAAAVRLERLDAPGDLSAGNAIGVSIDVAVPTGNRQAILISPRQPLSAGWYRVSVDGQPGNELTDLGGHWLSGVQRHEGSGADVMIFAVGNAQ